MPEEGVIMIQVLEFDGWLREQGVFEEESEEESECPSSASCRKTVQDMKDHKNKLVSLKKGEQQCNDTTLDQAVQWVDFTTLEGTNGYCDAEAAAVITERTANVMRELHPVTWIGNGNYHYVTHLLTMQIKDPFSLVVLDHHPDMQPSFFAELLSCGSWVLHALEHNPMLQQVILIGVKEELLQALPENPDVVPVVMQGELTEEAAESAGTETLKELQKWKQAQYHDRKQCESIRPSCLYQFICHGKTVTAISESFFQNVHDVSVLHTWIGKLVKAPLYLSVDKDVLCREDCITNWDSGSMKLSELLTLLEGVLCSHPVIGMDFCGESGEGSEPDALENNRSCNAQILQKLKEGFDV